MSQKSNKEEDKKKKGKTPMTSDNDLVTKPEWIVGVPAIRCFCGAEVTPFVIDGFMYHSRSDWRASEHGGWTPLHPAMRIEEAEKVIATATAVFVQAKK